MNITNLDIEQFEAGWTELASEICQAIYVNPRIQELKVALQKKGFLSLDEKSEFINLCDKIKYDLIFAKYGEENSQGYKDFSQSWEQWFQQKGVESQTGRTQRSSVDHILFGSTPEPAQFLLHFEEEILGRMKPKVRE